MLAVTIVLVTDSLQKLSYFDRIGLDEGRDLWTRWNLRIPPSSLETLGIFLYLMKSRLSLLDSDDPINSLP